MRVHEHVLVKRNYKTKLVTVQTVLRALYRRCLGDQPVLLSLEPKSSYPPNHSLWASAFPKRLDFGTQIQEVELRWPIEDSIIQNPNLSPDRKETKIAFIASNRCTASSMSNYALRRACVMSRDSLDLVVVGRGWQDTWKTKLETAIKAAVLSCFSLMPPSLSQLASYVMFQPQEVEEVVDKREFLERFRYSLVIENESTYVSEKLLEALLFGTKPLYVGPEIPESWVPSNLYLRADPDLDSIANSVRQLQKTDFEEHLANLESWIATGSAHLWSKNLLLK